MKKIKDIYNGEISESLDIRNPERLLSPEISKASGDILDDISAGEKKDISFYNKQKIKVEKKVGKHFDALEKKSAFSSLFRMKDIKLTGKKSDFSITKYRVIFFRYIKNLGLTGFIIAGFSIIILCGILGFIDKIIVENRVNSGYERLLEVKQGNLGLDGIKKNINNARFDLLLSDLLFIPFKIFPGEKIESVKHVISAGRYLSKGLDDTLGLYEGVHEFIGEKSIKKIYFTQLLLNLYPSLIEIEKSLNTALNHYKSITWLPTQDLENTRQASILNIENLQSYLSKITEKFTVFLNILGHNERKRYLIVFQNADEIRPTGGFMGSMGLVDIFRGRVQLFQKKDVYAIEWDLKKSQYERLVAPKGINELTDTFGLRDANYYVNLKDSSKAIKFFTDSAGIDLDGIIYINQNILLNLLDISGPIYFKPLDMDISSDNFSEVMSLMVEAKTFKQGTLGTPKQVLFDFMEVFVAKLINDANYFDYLQAIMHDVESRDIMMWSFNQQENEFLGSLGLNGQIDYDSTTDYMYPVYTSLSGNKSDRYMERAYKIQVESKENSCDFIINTQIKSSHNMPKQNRDFIQGLMSEYNLDTPNLFEIQGAARNRQFMRIILPNNAEITPQNGTDIVDYGQRKGLEFFLETPEQQATYYNYEYTLANPECQPYNTTIYKQAGISEFDISLNLYGEKFEYPSLQEDFYFEERK